MVEPSQFHMLDCAYANYGGANWPTTACVVSGTNDVGAEAPLGDGKWGQSDLAGNVWEWTLDAYATPYVVSCVDCAYLASAPLRSLRGGGFSDVPSYVLSSFRGYLTPTVHDKYYGARCARTP